MLLLYDYREGGSMILICIAAAFLFSFFGGHEGLDFYFMAYGGNYWLWTLEGHIKRGIFLRT